MTRILYQGIAQPTQLPTINYLDQPWVGPVPARARLGTPNQQFLASPIAPPATPTAPATVYPWAEPVRFKVQVREGVFASAILPPSPPNITAMGPWSEPIRIKIIREGAAVGPVAPVVIVQPTILEPMWHYDWSTPTRLKIVQQPLDQAVPPTGFPGISVISQEQANSWRRVEMIGY